MMHWNRYNSGSWGAILTRFCCLSNNALLKFCKILTLGFSTWHLPNLEMQKKMYILFCLKSDKFYTGHTVGQGLLEYICVQCNVRQSCTCPVCV